jgi:hypothetical protein
MEGHIKFGAKRKNFEGETLLDSWIGLGANGALDQKFKAEKNEQ